jgi:hypothetical protein
MKSLTNLGIAVLLFTANSFSQPENPMIDKLLKDAQLNLVPDKRTQVFNVRATLRDTTLIVRGDIHTAGLRDRLLEYLKENSHCSVVDSLTVLPHPSLGTKTFGVVSLSVANLRTEPEHSAEMATQAILGTPLKVLKREKGWFLVQTPEEYLGWTDDRIAMMDNAAFEHWVQQPKVVVRSVYGFTYQSADKAGQVVSDVVIGSMLAVKRDAGAFYEVLYPDGRAGFLAKEDAQPLQQWLEQAKDSPERIIATAKRFFGIPYLWGGTSSKGFDCSGFTKIVYFLNGDLLPRDADQQSNIGEPVDTSTSFQHVQAGDLLFFGSRATGDRRERVTHVGISLGGSRYIHCSGDVRINSFDPKDPDYSEYRRKSFLRSRRIIGTGVPRLQQLPYYLSHEL